MRLLTLLISLGLLGILGAVAGIAFILFYFGHDLPDYSALTKYDPPIVTRAYAGDGRLLAEFAYEKRVFVPVDSVPKLVINAFISAEDKNFFTHKGIDPTGIARAAVNNVLHPGRRMKGASTITQQVAKNFLLKDEVEAEKGDVVAKFGRKIREAILSFRIEEALPKNKILELYLNEIYLGARSYGIAAASLEYFNKPLDELTLEEAAYLAGLPKAPSDYDPEKRYDAAIARRNYVLGEMQDNGYITKAELDLAKLKPITTINREATQYVNYPYFAEEVRRKLLELYGEDGLMKGGLIAHSTMIPEYQSMAEEALRHGLINYDMRYGLHSDKLSHIETGKDWHDNLLKVAEPAGTGSFEMAVVLETGDKEAKVGLRNGREAVITLNKMKWAKRKGEKSARQGQRPAGRRRCLVHRRFRREGQGPRRVLAAPDPERVGRAHRHGPAYGPYLRARGRFLVPAQLVQPRDAGDPPAGFGLQAFRVSGRPGSGFHPRNADPRCALRA